MRLKRDVAIKVLSAALARYSDHIGVKSSHRLLLPAEYFGG
jgi:hypothetical protein